MNSSEALDEIKKIMDAHYGKEDSLDTMIEIANVVEWWEEYLGLEVEELDD